MTAPIRWASIDFSRYDTCFNLAVVFAVLVTAAALLSGCQSMTGETAGENLDDAVITAAVKAKLAAEKPASDALRDRAAELTRTVKGRPRRAK
jgi:hypothetical protein